MQAPAPAGLLAAAVFAYFDDHATAAKSPLIWKLPETIWIASPFRRSAACLEGNGKWVFPGYRGSSHIAAMGMLKAAFDKRLAALGWGQIVRPDVTGRPVEPGWTPADR